MAALKPLPGPAASRDAAAAVNLAVSAPTKASVSSDALSEQGPGNEPGEVAPDLSGVNPALPAPLSPQTTTLRDKRSASQTRAVPPLPAAIQGWRRLV